MDVKDWLRGVRGIEERIMRKKELMRRYDELATMATAPIDGDRVASSGVQSRIENNVVAKIMLEVDALDELSALYQLRHDVALVIGRVTDQRYRDVLEMRYINAMGMQQIADAMHYEKRWIEILHGRALNAVRAVLRDLPEIVRFYSLE